MVLYQAAKGWNGFTIEGGGYLVIAKSADESKGTVSGDNNLYMPNATATFSATPASGMKLMNWAVNGSPVSASNPYSFTPTEDMELLANFDDIGTDLDEVHANSISVYPNPTNGKVWVQAPNSKTPVISIYTLHGTLLQQNPGNEADLSAYPNGTYMLQVDDTLVKIVKE